MLLATGLVIVVVYLVLSINTYLETYAFGVFSLGYGRIGPTEARLALIALNTVMALGRRPLVRPLRRGHDPARRRRPGALGPALVALAVRARHNLRVLAEREPAGVARPA